MRRLLLTALVATCLAVLSHQASTAGDDAKPLQGVWIGQSMEADGKPAPAGYAGILRTRFQTVW